MKLGRSCIGLICGITGSLIRRRENLLAFSFEIKAVQPSLKHYTSLDLHFLERQAFGVSYLEIGNGDTHSVHGGRQWLTRLIDLFSFWDWVVFALVWHLMLWSDIWHEDDCNNSTDLRFYQVIPFRTWSRNMRQLQWTIKSSLSVELRYEILYSYLNSKPWWPDREVHSFPRDARSRLARANGNVLSWPSKRTLQKCARHMF